MVGRPVFISCLLSTQCRRRPLQSLLKAISDAQGNILENTTLIQTLETLKTESREIQAKMDNTEVVMQEITEVSNLYSPVALACSRIYFTLEQLGDLHRIYQWGLGPRWVRLDF